MNNKCEQLHVAVQDLLIDLGITPKRLKDIAANGSYNSINPKTARKLIKAFLIVEDHPILSIFNNIKSELPPEILWSYLREEHPEFLFGQMKDCLFPPG